MNPLIDTLLEKYVISGGIVMIPLVICSLLTLGMAMQGWIRLRRSRVMPAPLFAQARQAGPSAGRRSFIMSLRASPSPLGRAVWWALKDVAQRDKSPDLTEVDSLVEEATARAVDEMYDGLGALSTLYVISPLLGLFGTILGMMRTFGEFGTRGIKTTSILSVGIQEALITTLWGLGIAILAYVAIHWLTSIIQRYERHALPAGVRELIVTLYTATQEPADPGLGTIAAAAARRASQAEPQP